MAAALWPQAFLVHSRTKDMPTPERALMLILRQSILLESQRHKHGIFLFARDKKTQEVTHTSAEFYRIHYNEIFPSPTIFSSMGYALLVRKKMKQARLQEKT